MSSILVGVYHPGRTWLHRLPVGAKVLALMVLSLVIVGVRDPWFACVALVTSLLIAASGRVPLRVLWRTTRTVLLFAVFAAVLQWWWYGGAKAVETLLDVVALAILAVTLSATTSMQAMLDAFIAWLGPFRRFGVNPERVALTISLAIGALPAILALAVETRDAARARGLGNHPRAYLTPFVIRVVARAYETGDALAARGLD
ncbi:MAG: energy-coupling factor transporter transmembrane protein EcfT [Nocardioides sp.]